MKKVKNLKEFCCPPEGWNYLPSLIAVTVALWIVVLVMAWVWCCYDIILIPK